MSARYLLSLMLSVVFLLPGATFAAGPTTETVVVVPMDAGSQREAMKLQRIADMWTQNDGRYQLVDITTAAQSEAGKKMLEENAEKAAQALKAGLSSYDAMSYEQSLASLEEAAKLYQQSDLTRHLKGLLDTYAARVFALYYAGRVADARNQLVDLFTLEPDYAFDRSRMTPEVQQIVKDVQSSVSSAPTTTLEIQTTPPNTQIFVDGNYLGVAPAEAKKLAPGYHFVAAIAPGYAFNQSRQLAAPGHISQITLDPASKAPMLKKLLAGVKKGFAKKAWSKPDMALCNFAKAQQAFVVGVSTGASAGFTVRGARVASDGHLLAIGSADLPAGNGIGAAFTAFAKNLHLKDRPRGPGGQPITTIDTGFSIKAGPKLWGVIAGGAGILAIGGGVIMGVTANGTAARARQVPQLDEALYKKTIGQAHTQALVADILYLVGIAGAGTGAYLFFATHGGGSSGGSSGGDDVFSFAAPVPLPGGGGLVITGRF